MNKNRMLHMSILAWMSLSLIFAFAVPAFAGDCPCGDGCECDDCLCANGQCGCGDECACESCDCSQVTSCSCAQTADGNCHCADGCNCPVCSCAACDCAVNCGHK